LTDVTGGASSAVTAACRAFAERQHRRSSAERWGLSIDELAAALERSAAGRFAGRTPSAAEAEQYFESLHLDDLALACACAKGCNAAWDHFVREYRPVLLRVAGRGTRSDHAQDVADSIHAELYGLDERDGVRRSLFAYFHGRSSLAGWLRAVVAQRLVDRARAARRFEPLPDDEPPAPATSASPAFELDPDRRRCRELARQALADALAGIDARDRLRLSLYYAQGMRLAAIGRVLGESEATASRKLERTRSALRSAVEAHLRDAGRLTSAQIDECFEHARTDPAFDLARTLPPPQD
jgi:RNA polymerase sigma-70 factor (ECF subfamily)